MLIASAALVAPEIALCNRSKMGRAEFRCREIHLSEKLAGIAVLSFEALLVGNAVFRGVYNVLAGSFYPHNGEETQRYDQLQLSPVNDVILQLIANVSGNVVTAGHEALAAAFLHYLGIKDDGIHRLKHGNGKIA